MRRAITIILSIVILAIFVTCNDAAPELSNPDVVTPRAVKPNTQNTIMGRWKILSTKLENKVETSPGNYFLIFSEIRTNSIYELVLDKSVDVNVCSGGFTRISDDKISIGATWCTKVCCDSEFAETLIDVINSEMSGRATNYVMRNDSLILTSNGTIKLYRVK